MIILSCIINPCSEESSSELVELFDARSAFRFKAFLEKIMKYTLHNTFHGTTVSFFASSHEDGALGAFFSLSYDADMLGDKKAQEKIKRIKKALCGNPACGCAGMIREA